MDPIKILVVDDEPDILDFLRYNLVKEGYQVVTASNGEEGVMMAEKEKPGLVILDIMMPKMDGVEVCRNLRSKPEFDKTLIIFLTAREEDYSQIAALDIGGDDYITKPIRPRVFLSRIKALLRRSDRLEEEATDAVIVVGELEIDTERITVKKGEQVIELAKKEFELLNLLVSKPGKVFSREEIFNKVWGTDVIVGNRTIDVHIRKLREKIGDTFIKTIKGIGYKFEFQMLKNPTPKQIALFAALYICLVVSIVGGLLLGLESLGTPTWVTYLLVPLAVFLAAYWVTIYYLRKYIYRKIKLIYKTIHKHKRSPEDKTNSVDVSSDIIGEVEKEVEEWALTREAEINKHNAWAEYRRKYIGDISHELKTPIFNIQGFLHTLLDGALYDNEINHSFLKRAAKNVERLHTIVEDLSAISRLESGNLVLDTVSFDIKELTREVFEDLEFKAAQKDIILSFKEGADQNYRVRADIDSIRQVLTNLLHNSIKYGKGSGRTKVGFYDMDSNILIEVADNGIGIPATHLDHVFDRFYRVDKSRSRAQGGSGLGLSIVKHIIDAHKQTINVRSADNLGSTFGFTLEKAKQIGPLAGLSLLLRSQAILNDDYGSGCICKVW